VVCIHKPQKRQLFEESEETGFVIPVSSPNGLCYPIKSSSSVSAGITRTIFEVRISFTEVFP
ncbi:MAG: hypothetical protein KDA84_10205, partial [Planctomycetaceae bacterium]|nr:hypothetical protein [Planctomycetaceae bacterium]